jgi:hypothetical protein
MLSGRPTGELDPDRVSGVDIRLGSARRSTVRVLLSLQHPKREQLELLGLLESGGHLTDMVASTSNLVEGMTRHLADLKRDHIVGPVSWWRFRESAHVVTCDPPDIDAAAIPDSIHVVSVGLRDDTWSATLKLGHALLAIRIDVELSSGPEGAHRALTGIGLSPYVDVTEFRSVEADEVGLLEVARHFDR